MNQLSSAYVMPQDAFLRIARRPNQDKPQRTTKVKMPHFVLWNAVQAGIFAFLKQKEDCGADRTLAAPIGHADRCGIGAAVKTALGMRREAVAQ